MSGVSMGHNHRPCSAEKTFRRCTSRGNVDNVIHLDPDPDIFDNVVIIDLSESLSKRKFGSARLRKDKSSFTNVIYIDDDEAPSSSNFPGGNNANFSANTSNREPCPPNTNFSDSDEVGDGCPYIPDNKTPVRLSKCKRTYSGKAPIRNHYGLDTDSESDSSESDYPDCELVEDSSGKVHWEKAFYRRRKDCHNSRSDRGGHGSTSQNLGKNQHQDSGMEDMTREHEESSNDETGVPYAFRKEGTGFGCSTMFEDPIDLEFFQSEPGTKDGTDFGCSTAFEGPIDLECSQSAPGTKEGTEFGCSTTFEDPIDLECSQSSPEADLQNDANHRSTSQAKGSPSVCAEQGDFPDCVPGGFDDDITRTREREECLASSNLAGKDGNCPPRFWSFTDKNRYSQKSNSRDDPQRSVQRNEHSSKRANCEMEDFMPGACSSKRPTIPDSQINHSPPPSFDAVEQDFGKSPLSKNAPASADENKQPVPEMLSSVNIRLNQTKVLEDDSSSDGHQESENGPVQDVQVQNFDTLPFEEMSIINEREKIKETDEYKRALQEELASRQQVLAAQAEEAQRLRRLQRRRKAESMRLLDMEKRQKQRLEEIRNTQKKDEENMNLKETIRAEVRNELKKLENQCQNMASLLQLLGINVSGWPNPLPEQVQTAYKKALLTFHPDRASQYDIRLQVEAEEKFKLINRMKDKFSPSHTKLK